MRPIIKFILLSCLLTLSVSACAQQRFIEGTHYEKFSDKGSKEKQVLEFYSLFCGHCYRFEPIAKKIRTVLPATVNFQQIHVNFLGGSKDMQDYLTKTVIVSQQMGKQAIVKNAIYNYLHVQRARITNEQDVQNILALQGIDMAQFNKLMKSFTTNGLMRKNQKVLDQYRATVHGTPTLIVNGQYKVLPQQLRSEQDYIDIVNYLVRL